MATSDLSEGNKRSREEIMYLRTLPRNIFHKILQFKETATTSSIVSRASTTIAAKYYSRQAGKCAYLPVLHMHHYLRRSKLSQRTKVLCGPYVNVLCTQQFYVASMCDRSTSYWVYNRDSNKVALFAKVAPVAPCRTRTVEFEKDAKMFEIQVGLIIIT